MSINLNQSRGGGRRRSASESDGDVMSSTLNPTNPTQINKSIIVNNDRCISNPHLNVSGFIDDSYRDNMGTRLETRIQTRSKGGSNSIEARMRNEYTRIKIAIFEWGEIATYSVQPLCVIEAKHNELCTEIEQCIAEILLARGDYTLIGDFGNIKDRLNTVRKEAKQFSRAGQQQHIIPASYTDNIIPAAISDHNFIPSPASDNLPDQTTFRNSNLDNVFSNIPDNYDNRLSKTLPSSVSNKRGGGLIYPT